MLRTHCLFRLTCHTQKSLSFSFFFWNKSCSLRGKCFYCYVYRAEPILQRIKEDRTRIISPSFDNIKYDTFEIEEYPLSAQGYDWELWCRYLNPPKSWWNLNNSTAPIRYFGQYILECTSIHPFMYVCMHMDVCVYLFIWQCTCIYLFN